MTGWIVVAAMGVAAFLVLALGGVPRGLLTLVGATLLIGAAGYALQGRAGLAEHPAAADGATVAIDPATIDLRNAMLGRNYVTADSAFVALSDALARGGAHDRGAGALLSGVKQNPHSLLLWTALGTALARHDGAVSPVARLAFDRATRLGPDHPAPPFFRGQAYLESGDLDAARLSWQRALALSPRGTTYRREILLRLVALDLALAQRGP